MAFYTNCQVIGSKVLYRGISDSGQKERGKVDYTPTFFLPSDTPTKHTTIYGQYVSPIKPGSIKDCRDFIQRYKDVENFPIYGFSRYEYCFIADNFPGQVAWDRSKIRIANIDIEVGSENGFPEPESASEPITAITMKMGRKFIVFACGDFNNVRSDVRYVKCSDELDLVKQFLAEWTGDYPDAVTGWHIKFFDIPYLVNRITKLFGEKVAATLSPWGIINERMVYQHNKQQKAYILLGTAILDYIELYRKFHPNGNSRENYKLDYICSLEVGERKLSYEEYGSLHKLYRENFQLFIEYNIRDVELVEKLDHKCKLLDMVLTLAYDNKCNYEDVFAQVRMWDVIIFNHLRGKNMVVPQFESHSKDEAYVGAYVKEPILGMHRWVVSFDLNSLYPHLIMQHNISPETLLESRDYVALAGVNKNIKSQKIGIDEMLEKKVDTSALPAMQCTLTPNGQLFTTKKHGFLAELMEDMYNARNVYKGKAKEAKKKLQGVTDPGLKAEIEAEYAGFNNLQLAKKVSLNSAYGALGNQFFRFFDVRQASAITTAGQLAIRWIEIKLNEYLNKILGTSGKDYIIASDTDSVYICLDELVRQAVIEPGKASDTDSIIKYMDKVCESMLQPFIDKTYHDLARYTNAYAQKMEMKREALADIAIWTGKKRYIINVHNNEGVQYKVPDVKVMGLEMIKSSTPSACRDKLKESVSVMLSGTESDMHKFVADFRKEFKTLPIQDIAFPRGINGIVKYYDPKAMFQMGTPIHTRGALIYNHYVKTSGLTKAYPLITDGEKIRFVFLKEPNPVQSNVISFPQVLPKEIGLHGYIDYNLQFQKSFLDPLKIILDCIGWTTEKTNSLGDFFT